MNPVLFAVKFVVWKKKLYIHKKIHVIYEYYDAKEKVNTNKD